MRDEQNQCLTAPEILAYLEGGLTEDRRAEVGNHLDTCRLCGDAVEGVAGLEWREGFLRSTDALLKRIRARSAAVATAAAPPLRRPAPRFRQAAQYLTLAATLVVGVGTAVVLTRPGPGEVLFERHFEPYPSMRPVVRGGAEADSSRALDLYEARDYRGALAAFEQELGRAPNDAMARFYAGLCRMAVGRDQEATLDLERVLRLGEKELHAPAEWYLALIHLRGNDPAEARPHLERISAAGGFYQDKARALLSELALLDRRD
jgi:tetratricopeptide (TPR) repeat protein